MLRAAEGSSSTSRSALTSSGAATLCNGMYGSLYMYVCMYSSWLLIDGSPSIPIPYRRASARWWDRWRGKGGKTETMYVCMSWWMCMDRGYWCWPHLWWYIWCIYMHCRSSRITARHVKGSRYGRRMQIERRDLQTARNSYRRRSYCQHDHLQGSALLRDEGAGQGQQPDQQVCIFTFLYLLVCMNLIK
jgi:hypothetical protein